MNAGVRKRETGETDECDQRGGQERTGITTKLDTHTSL